MTDTPAAGGRRHVVLVGLMGSGKTTVGGLLAERLGLPFRDNDVALESSTGRTAAELARDRGDVALHRHEARVLRELLDADEPTVITAAASTIDDPTCRDAMARRGFVVWLDADVDALAERVVAGAHRPLERTDVRRQLEEMQRRRAPHYEHVADLRVDAAHRPPEHVADQVAAAFRTT